VAASSARWKLRSAWTLAVGSAAASRPAVRLPLAGIDPASVYRHGAQRYSGSHLTAVGLPVRWTAEHDAELVVLRRA
jgi:Glycosyl hydrolase family 36 C-terminal domain